MSARLDQAIEDRRARTGTRYPPSIGQRINGPSYSMPGPIIGPIVSTAIPPWLTVGASIALKCHGHSVVTVIETDPRMCLVRGGEHSWAIETAIIADHWKVSP